MCSNTSSGDGGGDSGGEGGGWSPRLSKSPKRQKVPKRGPGVAELEKILREQEKHPGYAESANMESFSSCCFASSFPKPPYPPPPPPPPPMTKTLYPTTPTNPSSSSSSSSLNRHVFVAPILDHFSRPPPPPVTTTFNTGRSGVALPEQALFPLTCGSCKSNVDRMDGSKSDSDSTRLSTQISSESNSKRPFPLPQILQNKHSQYHPTTANHNFPRFASPSPAKVYHHIEPPSNQRFSHNYTSVCPEEEEMIRMKRLWPILVENAPDPLFHFPVPPVFPSMHRSDQSSSCDNRNAFNLEVENAPDPLFHYPVPPVLFPSMHRSDQSSSCDNRNAFNLEHRNTISRDARQGDYGPPDNNFLAFGSSAIPSPPGKNLHHEFSDFHSLPFQESMEGPRQRSGPGVSDRKKPFHGVFQSKEQMGRKERTLSLNDDRGEAEGDGIDLTLKL